MWSVVGGRWLNNRNLVGGRWSAVVLVGDLTTVIWSVVGCCSGRWSVFSQPLVGGRWFFRSVVDGSFGRWSVVGGAWSVVGVTVVGGRWSVVGGWSVGGGFVLRRT